MAALETYEYTPIILLISVHDSYTVNLDNAGHLQQHIS